MAEEYFYQEYPRMLFHPDGRTVTVHTEEEEGKWTGEGFVKSPTEYGVETAPAAGPTTSGGFRAYAGEPPAASTAAPAVLPPEEEGSSGGRY